MIPRVLHVFPGFGPGGTELRTVALINALGSEFQHGILSLTGDVSASVRLDPELGVEMLAAPPRGNAAAWPLALRRVARNWRPDLIVTYNWGATDMILGALPASSCAFIHNECGFGPDEAERMIPRRVWTRRLLLNRIFKTVVVSERLLGIARTQFRISPSKLQFIRTGVRTDRFTPGRNFVLRRELGILDDELVFGFAGVLREEKNLPLLIAAFAAAGLDGSKLLVVGDGPLRPMLESLAREPGAAGRVVFAGRAADPLPYYRAMDVFCMSSITEQTSNAQLEAMSCARPCIVTDVGDCAAVLGEQGRGFVVASGGQTAYAGAMTALARDPASRLAAGEANRRRVETVYSFERMVGEYAALWRSALVRGIA